MIFSCLANCDKLISYHWKANNKTIDGDAESRYTIDTNGTLEIASTTEEDRGTYQCYVMTNDGQQKLGESATARLDIKGKCRSRSLRRCNSRIKSSLKSYFLGAVASVKWFEK